ncbi:hypothetical protein [Micromonospora sp. NPDC093277]|uniref:hypothetical protein n=1 Tax=Micromonospora sp. NPDC093277 TaxID=3364291 RepID=UPI00381BB8CF
MAGDARAHGRTAKLTRALGERYAREVAVYQKEAAGSHRLRQAAEARLRYGRAAGMPIQFRIPEL